MRFNVMDFGARADGRTLDTKAFQDAVDRCSDEGGGLVFVPEGRYLLGSLWLKSNIVFCLDAGAELIASLNPADYQLPDDIAPDSQPRACLNALHEENVRICGSGVVFGQVMSFSHDDPANGGNGEEHLTFDDPKQFRPKLLRFEDVRGTVLSGITFRESPFWTIHFAGCRDTLVENIRVENPLRACNTDALDIDCCRNFTARGLYLQTGDDGVCVKSSPEVAKLYGGCENVRIEDCEIHSTSAALKVGTETFAPIRNVSFDDCSVFGSSHAIAVYARDGGEVENIVFRNISGNAKAHGNAPRHKFRWSWWGAGDAVFISASPRRKGESSGTIRNVVLKEIDIDCENSCFISSYPETGKVENIFLSEVKLRFVRQGTQPGGVFDETPSIRNRFPHRIPAFFFENIRNASVEKSAVEWVNPEGECWDGLLENENSELLRFECTESVTQSE